MKVDLHLVSLCPGVVDFDDLKEVLGKIGVQERKGEPLRIEVAVGLHNRVVAYHAADASTVTTIPNLIKKLSEYKVKYKIEVVLLKYTLA